MEKITYKKLVELCKADIDDISSLEDCHICELVSCDTAKKIKSLASEYSLQDNEYYKLLKNYQLESCSNRQEVKEYILWDAIDDSVRGEKSSFTSIKKKFLAEA